VGGIGVGGVGPGKYPVLYWDINSLLLMASAGEQTRARMTTILITKYIFFIFNP
jgi:hypothetical protein